MKNIRQISSHRIEIKEGGGCMAFFGLPFFAAGIFLILISLRVIPLSNAHEVPAWSWPVIAFMGLVFTGVGGWLTFGRTWTLLDTMDQTLVKRWGLLFPMQQKTSSLADYRRIVMEFVEGDSDTADQYPLTLKGEAEEKGMQIYVSLEYKDALEKAMLLARFLQFSLEDSTTGTKTAFSHERIDENLQDRMKKEERQKLSRPQEMRSQVHESAGRLQISIPAEEFKWSVIWVFLVPALLFVFFGPSLLSFFERTATPSVVQWVALGFILFFFIGIPLIEVVQAMVRAARACTFVTVTPQEVVVLERGAWFSHSLSIPAVEIIGIDYLPLWRNPHDVPDWASSWANRSKGITIKSKNGLCTFGFRLSNEESAYLCARIKDALAGKIHLP